LWITQSTNQEGIESLLSNFYILFFDMKQHAVRWLLIALTVNWLGLSFVWNSIEVPVTWNFDMFFPTVRLVFVTVLIMYGSTHVANIINDGFDDF